MARVSSAFIRLNALALVLMTALGCGGADKAMNDTTVSGAAANGSTNNSGSGSASGQTGQPASAGTGGNGAAGSDGHAGMNHTDRGGTGRPGTGSGGTGNDAGSMPPPDAGMPSPCVIQGDQLITDGTTISQGDCDSCTCHNGDLQCTTTQVCPASCVVARHLDTCCATYEPVSTAALSLNECLAAYPGTGLDPDVLQRCAAKSPTNCAVIDCADEIPPSRVAVDNDAGGCGYGDECQKDQDCGLAFDSSTCCSCVQSMPASLLAGDECLLRPGGATGGLPGTCPGCSVMGSCATLCPAPPASAKCVLDTTFKTCK